VRERKEKMRVYDIDELEKTIKREKRRRG